MVLVVSREDGSSVVIHVQQELDVNRGEGESCYGLVFVGDELVGPVRVLYRKVLN